ncbi:MAG: AraC family transcriptional regulator [Acidobacteriota bacterium]
MKTSTEKIKVWRPDDIEGVELRTGEGVTSSYPRHWHEEYHLCVLEEGAGELVYRGSRHFTAAGSLFIIEPGEVHSHNKPFDELRFRNLYADAQLVRCTASDIAGRDKSPPVFKEPVITDRDIIASYITLHSLMEKQASTLERESLMIDFFAQLITRYGEDRRIQKAGREQQAVYRARDYLIENFSSNVSLQRLAEVARLSPFHLSRVFTAEMGMPPHAFQTQVRVTRAKEMLRRGVAISRTAMETGFADQSHLNRHFKRLLQVTPGQYIQNSKNVQDRF